MSSKASIGSIICAHLSTLRDYTPPDHEPEAPSPRVSLSLADTLLFFVVPLLVGVVAAVLDVHLRLSDLLTAVSVLGGLSFGTVVFVFELRISIGGRYKSGARPLTLVNQLFTNLLYSVIVALLLVVLLILPTPTIPWLAQALLGVIVAVLVHYLLTLLMCIKRLNSAYREAIRF